MQKCDFTLKMTVLCSIDDVSLPTDSGHRIDGVLATCSRCGHDTESFGTSDASVRRCLALMRETCPKNENNYYVSRSRALAQNC